MAFLVSILLIGALTAVIGDLSSHLGCTVGLKDTVTAIAFVALGTSIPGKEIINKCHDHTHRHTNHRPSNRQRNAVQPPSCCQLTFFFIVKIALSWAQLLSLVTVEIVNFPIRWFEHFVMTTKWDRTGLIIIQLIAMCDAFVHVLSSTVSSLLTNNSLICTN